MESKPKSVESKIIKWGIVGCGRISHRFMQGLAVVEGSELEAVWSRRAETVDDFVSKYGGKPCHNFDELIDSDIDVLYISTLPDSHADYAIRAMQAGKHVLCEKPAAINLPQLDEVLAVARQTGLLFMEGMKPPFYPLYQKLKEHLTTDPIGPIGYVRAGSAVVDCPPEHPNYSHELIGGSLMQIGIYEAFLALDWLGPTVDVQAMGRFSGREIDMFSIFQSQHQGGYAQLYCGLDLHGKGDALLAGPLGHVTIHKNWWNPAKATISYADGRTIELDEPFTSGGLNYEIQHFCDLIRTGKTESPIISHELSRQMIGLIDQSRELVGLRYPGE